MIKATLERKQVPGAFNFRQQWRRGGMMWVVTVEGSFQGYSDGEYIFNRKKDAVAAHAFATTEWDGAGCLADSCHQWMINTRHELRDSWKGEF